MKEKTMEAPTKKVEKKYRVEARCSKCDTFLMGSNEKPHFTLVELSNEWISLVMSAPINAPRCPKCKNSTDSDYNAGVVFYIDDGKKSIESKRFWEKTKV